MQLRMRHGMAGYGVYIALLEMLAAAPDLRLPCNYRSLALTFCVTEDLIRSVVEDFNLFSFTEDRASFFSPEVQGDVLGQEKKKERRSAAAKLAAKARWNEKDEEMPMIAFDFEEDANRIKNNANRIQNDANRIKNNANRIENDANRIKNDANRIPPLSYKKEKETEKEILPPTPPIKEKDKEKERTALAPHAHEKPAKNTLCTLPTDDFSRYDQWEPQLRNNTVWRQEVELAVFRATPRGQPPLHSPDTLLDEFLNMQRMGGKLENTFGDFRHHFSRWLKVKLSNTQRYGKTSENSPKRQANAVAIARLAEYTQELHRETDFALPDPL